ncbi:cell wall binding repeat 2 family protein [Clostridioides difficile DA00132]|nr:cell wall binding repeat 2 family protein [Clostridioides difficile DA00132]
MENNHNINIKYKNHQGDMKMNKKILSLGLAVSLILVNFKSVNASSVVEKIYGKDRYETAAKIADKQTYETVILVNTEKSLADGLVQVDYRELQKLQYYLHNKIRYQQTQIDV